jgi:hypothetical protein
VFHRMVVPPPPPSSSSQKTLILTIIDIIYSHMSSQPPFLGRKGTTRSNSHHKNGKIYH